MLKTEKKQDMPDYTDGSYIYDQSRKWISGLQETGADNAKTYWTFRVLPEVKEEYDRQCAAGISENERLAYLKGHEGAQPVEKDFHNPDPRRSRLQQRWYDTGEKRNEEFYQDSTPFGLRTWDKKDGSHIEKGVYKGHNKPAGLFYSLYEKDMNRRGPYFWVWNQKGHGGYPDLRTSVSGTSAEEVMSHPYVIQSLALHGLELDAEETASGVSRHILRHNGKEIAAADTLDTLLMEHEAVQELLLGDADIASSRYYPGARTIPSLEI